MYHIPNPEEPACYDKLIREFRNVFIADEAEKLDILLNDLSLGDRSLNELMHQLIAASGTDENCSPQLETLLKDRFIKALPSEIAANSGTWTHTNLRSLANCATQAMTFLKRYGKSKVALKIDKSEASDVEPKKFFQPKHNRKIWHSDKPNFLPHRFNNYQRKSNQKKQTWHLNNRRVNNQKWQKSYQPAFQYICYNHRRFKEKSFKCECKYYFYAMPQNALNCEGRQF